jgi:hypothetical protein
VLRAGAQQQRRSAAGAQQQRRALSVTSTSAPKASSSFATGSVPDLAQ